MLLQQNQDFEQRNYKLQQQLLQKDKLVTELQQKNQIAEIKNEEVKKLKLKNEEIFDKLQEKEFEVKKLQVTTEVYDKKIQELIEQMNQIDESHYYALKELRQLEIENEELKQQIRDKTEDYSVDKSVVTRTTNFTNPKDKNFIKGKTIQQVLFNEPIKEVKGA